MRKQEAFLMRYNFFKNIKLSPIAFSFVTYEQF